MIERVRQYLRQKRLAFYSHLIAEKPLDANDARLIAGQLASLWREIKPADVILTNSSIRGLLVLDVWTKNVVDLVDLLKQINQLIVQEKDSQLEALIFKYQERYAVTVDFYLADEKHHPIDEVATLTRLRGLLQEHFHLLKQQENQYYQRLSSKFYHDAVELTETLVTYSSDAGIK